MKPTPRNSHQRRQPAVQDDPHGFVLMRNRTRNPHTATNVRRACELLRLYFVEREVADNLIEAAFGFRPTDRAWESWLGGMNRRAIELTGYASEYRRRTGGDWLRGRT